MGVGNLLAIRADERAREAAALPQLEAYPWKHGARDHVCIRGRRHSPLLRYVVPGIEGRLVWPSGLTFVALFMLGASRALVTVDQWWRSAHTVGRCLGAHQRHRVHGMGAVLAMARSERRDAAPAAIRFGKTSIAARDF
jgi:hypothetical protein